MSLPPALESITSDALLDFLKTQRWFGVKGASPSAARFVDAVTMPWSDGKYAIARVVVSAGGAEHWYQLPVTVDGSNLDATRDDEFRRGLVAALSSGATAGEDVKWIAEHVGGEPIGGATKVGSAEQSNTSIVVGDRAIIKLFRALRAGIHPDVEVTRFLTTQADFTNTPKLLGSARFESNGESMIAAMMQSFVAGSSDAWSYALEKAKPYFTSPKGKDLPNTFVDDARRLGEITRAMHEALASDDDDPAFAPEDVEPEDLDRWAHRTQQMIRDSISLLERAVAQSGVPKERLAEAQALIHRRDHFIGWINEIDDNLGDDVGMRIRVHGDYHLGQVLRSPANDFLVIDFEGEPTRAIEERREKTSPLKDVAGMLRSFAYAAATLAMSIEKTHDVPTREVRVARWERDVRAAYLDGYLNGSRDDGPEFFLPEDETHVRQLISLFEAEKAFYELAYELNNRPAWAWIPMRGIAKLFH
jgi:maltose alpha-D-glucosyltransferase/alpha-amylase